MSRRGQLVILVSVYTLFVIGTMYWSGAVTERTTLYDRFLITLEGAHLTTTDAEALKRFYTEILDFTLIEPNLIELPQEKKLLIRELANKRQAKGLGTIVDIKVRNGISSLHERLVTRTGLDAAPLEADYQHSALTTFPPAQISELIQQPWGKEFIVKDTDGNVVVFFQPKRFLRSRY